MSSKKILKSTGSALVLGSSLASLVGQQSANADLLGSIKKWFFGDKTKNKEKKLSLKERKEKHNYNHRNRILPYFGLEAIPAFFVGTFFSAIYAGFYYGGGVLSLSDNPAAYKRLFGKGVFFSALISIGLGIYSYITNMSAENNFTELKESIGESLLEKHWNLKEFQKMASSDADIEKFLKQLLVLESSSSGNNDKGAPILDNDNLNEKVQAFKNLFKNEPEKLKNNGEIYKELIDSLYVWCCGKMERLYDDSREGRYDEKKYFKAQEDIELASKIVLLREIVLGENIRYPESLSFLTSQDFYKHLTDESKPNFKKLLLHDIREYVSQEDVSDEDIINILKELTKSNQVGTIKSRRNKFARDYVNVPVVSADDKNMRRYGEIFNKELKTFLKQREKEKSGDLKGIYEKQLGFLQGIKDFSDQKHRFNERFDRIKLPRNYDRPEKDLGFVDNLSFRAEAAYKGILKEYNNLKEAEKNK